MTQLEIIYRHTDYIDIGINKDDMHINVSSSLCSHHAGGLNRTVP